MVSAFQATAVGEQADTLAQVAGLFSPLHVSTPAPSGEGAPSSVLAPEIDDGSIVYLLAKPISRHTVVVGKLVVAFGCAVAFAVVPMLVSGLVLASSHAQLAFAYSLGALAAGAAYTALFAWLSTLSRHSVLLGLIYVLF